MNLIANKINKIIILNMNAKIFSFVFLFLLSFQFDLINGGCVAPGFQGIFFGIEIFVSSVVK